MVLPKRADEESFNQRHNGAGEAANDSSYTKKDKTAKQRKLEKAANDPVYTERRMGADRSNIVRRGETRNVRSGGRAATEQKPWRNEALSPSQTHTKNRTNPNEPTSVTFIAEYKKAGLQPSNLDDKTDKKHYQPIQQVTRANQSAQVIYMEKPTPSVVANKIKLKDKKKGGKLNFKSRVIGRVMQYGGNYVWLSFQLPFAILSLIFFGLAVALSAFFDAIEVSEDDGILVLVGKTTLARFIDIASASIKLLGVNLEAINPAAYFMMLHGLVMLFGVFLLLLIFIVFTVFGIKCLSGERSGAKQMALLGAFIGYSIPFLNFFGWFAIWVYIVSRHPK